MTKCWHQAGQWLPRTGSDTSGLREPKTLNWEVRPPNRVASRGTTKPNKEAESKREKASTRINLQGSHERREQDDVARQAAYQPAMDNWSHRLSNQTSLNINPEPYPPVNRTSKLAFGSTTHETHLTTEREELEEIQEPAAVEEIQDPYPPAILWEWVWGFCKDIFLFCVEIFFCYICLAMITFSCTIPGNLEHLHRASLRVSKGGGTILQKTVYKVCTIRNMCCVSFALFAGPTDTWRSAIGALFFLVRKK